MLGTTQTRAAAVRSRLAHPVVDADGHFVELGPLLDDEIVAYLEEEGGAELRDRYRANQTGPFDTSVESSAVRTFSNSAFSASSFRRSSASFAFSSR